MEDAGTMARRNGGVRLKRSPANRLTLKLEGKAVPSERFLKAVGAFFDLIGDVSEQIAGDRKAVKWVVTVQPGSVELHADPRGMVPGVPIGMIANSFVKGVKQLDRSAKKPAGWTEAALRHARELGSVADGAEVAAVTVKSARTTARVDSDVVEHVDRLLLPRAKDYGSVEGRLETISVKGGAHVVITDPVTGRSIRCVIDDARLASFMAFFTKRVAVFGMISYNENGEPTSIKADEVQPLPDDPAELVTADEIHGVFSR